MKLIYTGRIAIKLPNAKGEVQLVMPFDVIDAGHDVFDNRPRLSRVLLTVDEYLRRIEQSDDYTLRQWSRFKEFDPSVDIRSALLALVPRQKGAKVTADDLAEMTGAQLATVCEELGLPYRGTKAEKRERIEGFLSHGG